MAGQSSVVSQAPTETQARSAADVLCRQGATCVLLFGSVADGTADGDSDIDLIAIFDDIDYHDRLPIKSRLEAACTASAGRTVDLWLTDWPEWSHRVSNVSASFEAHIQPHCLQLIDRRPDNHLVNWGKDIGMAETNLEEALNKLDDVRGSLVNLRDKYNALDDETSMSTYAKTLKTTRLRHLCADASMVVETSLKALTVMGGNHPQRTHSIADLLGGCPTVPTRMLDALEPLRENTIQPASTQEYDDITRWRAASTYGGEPDIASDHLERLARQLADIAIVAAEETYDRIVSLGADPNDNRLDFCREQLQATAQIVTSNE